MTSKLLTNDQAAALLGLSPETLPVWRVRGRGPQHIKVGRLVRYRESDLQAWLDAQTRASTSQLAGAAA